jgi:hypothetical protein
VRIDRHDYLTDQRFYATANGNFVETRMRRSLRRSNFFIPLD